MTTETVNRLQAFRLGHCVDCGCARCRRIDQLLADKNKALTSHPETNSSWLIEGQLLQDEHGTWQVQMVDGTVALDHALTGWRGYRVLILFGECK